jgi:hypothetical protein
MELQEAKKYLQELVDGEYPAPHGISELDLEEIRRNQKFINSLISVDGIKVHLKRMFGSSVIPNILFPDNINVDKIDSPKQNVLTPNVDDNKQLQHIVNGVDLTKLSPSQLRKLHNILRAKKGLPPLPEIESTGKRGRPKGSTNNGEPKPKQDKREPKIKKIGIYNSSTNILNGRQR